MRRIGERFTSDNIIHALNWRRIGEKPERVKRGANEVRGALNE